MQLLNLNIYRQENASLGIRAILAASVVFERAHERPFRVLITALSSHVPENVGPRAFALELVSSPLSHTTTSSALVALSTNISLLRAVPRSRSAAWRRVRCRRRVHPVAVAVALVKERAEMAEHVAEALHFHGAPPREVLLVGALVVREMHQMPREFAHVPEPVHVYERLCRRACTVYTQCVKHKVDSWVSNRSISAHEYCVNSERTILYMYIY